MPGAAAAVKPDERKSSTQETFDKTRREKDTHSEGPVDKVSRIEDSLVELKLTITQVKDALGMNK